MTESNPYSMTLSLNVLNHLGINLYSNMPAVLAEVVANSWDADAELVTITIDRKGKKIVISDDGHGMTKDDINLKYLTVGYQRREVPEEATTPKWKRSAMGRKGIGKLSLFSIARTIEIHTVKEGQKRAFRMVLSDIEAKIRNKEGTYHPQPIDASASDLERGTRIVLTDLKKELHQTENALRKRLARRFSIIGSEFHFSIQINGKPITIEDRDYYHKIQYLWWYGKDSERYRSYCKNLKMDILRPHLLLPTDYAISGWIGTVKDSGDLKDPDDNLNKIVIMVRGKLAQEDILEDFAEGGMYTKYLIGEVHANFLDIDGEADIATSSRQKIIEDDPRYEELKKFIYKELKNIQSAWTDLRNKEGKDKALEIPAIKEWFQTLPPDSKKQAESIFGKINQLTLDSEEDRKRLFKHGVLAFESLKYKQNLDALDQISTESLAESLDALADIFGNLDDIEATLYHQIIKERVAVIRTLQEKVKDNALEKVVQKFLFDHLWLLDPSWDRATETPVMEEQVSQLFKEIESDLKEEEKKSRLDIKYRKTSGQHVVIELKRPERVVSTAELLAQVDKYRRGIQKLLKAAGRSNESVAFVCVVGKELSDWTDDKAREESAKIMEQKNARVVMYQELIDDAYQTYKLFLDKKKEAGRIFELIQNIEGELQ